MFSYFIAVVLVVNTIAEQLSFYGNCNDAIKLAGCRSLANNGVSVLPNQCDELEELALPLRSCKEILSKLPTATSGCYNILLTNGTMEEVYCEMDGSNCDGTGGWTRIGLIDMMESSTTCPEGFVDRTSYSNSIRTCGSDVPLGNVQVPTQCRSMFFANFDSNFEYENVCGRIRGYQYGTPDTFFPNTATTIDNRYLDGFSITHSSNPRTHIWSYAAGTTTNTGLSDQNCPCNTGNTVQSPSFVDNDYYCESATDVSSNGMFFSDVLWDGQECATGEIDCCTVSPNLPWFNKTLDAATTSEIEIRACQSNGLANEGVFFDLIEIYIK